MQRDEVISLPVSPRGVTNPLQYILEKARGRRVLNVGAAGGVEHYLPGNRNLWLHHQLSEVADELIGIDIDEESVSFASQHGVELLVGNCETCRFPQPFDVIVMSDVVEHVNAPVHAIANLVELLSPGGCLLITTPNPTHYSLVLRAWLRGHADVYYDHMSAFLPEHFQAICMRRGLLLTDVVFFSHNDARSASNKIKSVITRLVGLLMPRCHSSFLVAIQA